MKKFHILRLPIVHSFGKPNIGSFMDEAIINIKNDKKVYAFENIKRCFVRIDDLLKLLKILILNKKFGLYNTGSIMTSYYDRVKHICDYLNLSHSNLLYSSRFDDVWKESNKKVGEVFPIEQNLDTRRLKKNINFSFN